MENIFKEGWQDSLNSQMLNPNCKNCAYICSPLSAKTDNDLVKNMISARAYMYYMWQVMRYPARAPHAYLPMLLCDHVPRNRQLALNFGRELLRESSMVLICGNRISEGMKLEIIQAGMLDIPIIAFNEEVYQQIISLLRNYNEDITLAALDTYHPILASPYPLEYTEEDVAGHIKTVGDVKKELNCYIAQCGGILNIREADNIFNNFSRELIDAIKNRYGSAYLVNSVKAGSDPDYKCVEYIGQKIYNAEYDICVPKPNEHLLHLIYAWENGIDDIKIDQIHRHLDKIGGVTLLWR